METAHEFTDTDACTGFYAYACARVRERARARARALVCEREFPMLGNDRGAAVGVNVTRNAY